jgi:hypothetical protein
VRGNKGGGFEGVLERLIKKCRDAVLALHTGQPQEGWREAATAVAKVARDYRCTHEILDRSTLVPVPLGRLLDLERALSGAPASPRAKGGVSKRTRQRGMAGSREVAAA